MTDSRLALVIGLFVVPAVLLWLGHRLRRQSDVRRRVFWGALIGYLLGMIATLIAIHYPPVLWAGADWRTALVHWGMVVGATLGAGLGRLARAKAGHPVDPLADKTRRIQEAHEEAITDYHDVFRNLSK